VVTDSFGYSFLKAYDPKQVGYLYSAAAVWKNNPRGGASELVRNFRNEIKEVEKWYNRQK
jgi:hypothetical protein